MTISWTWTPADKAEAAPSIGDQYISMEKNVLCLRNPMPADSAFMATMFSATIVITLLLWLWMFCAVINDTPSDEAWVLFIPLLLPLGVSLFLFYRIHLIRSQSNFYFNRHTQKIYYLKGKTLLVGDWAHVKAGVMGRTEFFRPVVQYHYFFGPECIRYPTRQPASQTDRQILGAHL